MSRRPSWMRALQGAATHAETTPCQKKQRSTSEWFVCSSPSSGWMTASTASRSTEEAPTPFHRPRWMLSLQQCQTDRQPAFDEKEEDDGYIVDDVDDPVIESDDADDGEHTVEPSRRLWKASVVYPKGVTNWRDAINCQAAADYECPCGKKCLSRVGVIEMYEHRKQLRANLKQQHGGGLRDVFRKSLEALYDHSSGNMQQAFVVAGFGGICERAYAVASSISEATFVRARADVTRKRPWHSDRVQCREKRIGVARSLLDSWVRSQRNSMEGDKTSGQKWYTEKTTEKQLWRRYVKCCDHAQQPTVGSSRLLHDIWKTHTEIVEVKPTGHAICETCSDIHAERLSMEGLDDAESSARRIELDAEAEAHAEFHTRERQYYDDAVCMATYHPQRTTCITIDAPTAHQFDLPSQARAKRDTSKRLDGTCRWQSKIEGVIDAGVGMLVYVAHFALGGGANLVATVLILTLVHHVEVGRPLGARLHLQLDNTTAENKNHTMVGVAGLLVAWGWFHEVVIFYMPVGHTYNELDAAFGPLITTLLHTVVATIRELLEFITTTLAIKNVRVVRRIHHLWDFNEMMKACMHPLGGFARTQQSSGMHEFHITRDSESVVRVHARQSSQASTWFPEGAGEPVFKHVPSANEAPPMAPPTKNSSAWRRSEVNCNVRRWLPNIGLHTDRLQLALREWESDFQTAVDDVSELPDDLKLVWKPLPPAQSELAPRVATTSAARLDMIENPPVNPMYGHQRRQSDVRAELQQWQSDQRTAAQTNGECAPVFLADYLIVRIQDVITLARVCGAPPGGATRETDVVDLVQYEHTPNPAVGGLFGTFKPLKNPDYDRTAKGSLAFVRHRDVSRSNMLVYNVSTFGSAPQELRIAESSLRLLAALCPESAAMPDELPVSHRDGSNGGSSRNRPSASAQNAPAVSVGTRIAVHWTEEPVGWFNGRVTSHRRDGEGAWISRILYESVEEWREHAQWHILDATHADAVEWRLIDDV